MLRVAPYSIVVPYTDKYKINIHLFFVRRQTRERENVYSMYNDHSRQVFHLASRQGKSEVKEDSE